MCECQVRERVERDGVMDRVHVENEIVGEMERVPGEMLWLSEPGLSVGVNDCVTVNPYVCVDFVPVVVGGLPEQVFVIVGLRVTVGGIVGGDHV